MGPPKGDFLTTLHSAPGIKPSSLARLDAWISPSIEMIVQEVPAGNDWMSVMGLIWI